MKLAKHIANTYQQVDGRDDADVLARIRAPMDAEWSSATDAPTGTIGEVAGQRDNHPLQWTGPGVGVASAIRLPCFPAGPGHLALSTYAHAVLHAP